MKFLVALIPSRFRHPAASAVFAALPICISLMFSGGIFAQTAPAPSTATAVPVNPLAVSLGTSEGTAAGDQDAILRIPARLSKSPLYQGRRKSAPEGFEPQYRAAFETAYRLAYDAAMKIHKNALTVPKTSPAKPSGN